MQQTEQSTAEEETGEAEQKSEGAQTEQQNEAK